MGATKNINIVKWVECVMYCMMSCCIVMLYNALWWNATLSLDRMCQHRLHAVLWLHIGTLMHSLAAEPCSTAKKKYSRTFIPFSVSLWNDLASSVFDGVGLVGFKSRANASLLA